MQRRSVLLLVAVALVAVACSATPTVTNVAGNTAVGEAVQEPALAADLNSGAAWDQYVIDNFADTYLARLGEVETILSAFCLGLVDGDSIEYLTLDQTLQKRILDTDERDCNQFETTSAILQQSPTPGEATFEGNVEARFGRVVWWSDLADFMFYAESYCVDPPSPGAPDDRAFELSVSAQIELDNMVRAGECDLPSRTDVAGTDELETESDDYDESDTHGAIVTIDDFDLSEKPQPEGLGETLAYDLFGQPLDATLYMLAPGESNLLDIDVHAVHLGSGNTTVVDSYNPGTQLVGFPDATQTQVVASPDGTQVAIARPKILAVGPSVASSEEVATRFSDGPIAWSSDGASVLFGEPSGIKRYVIETSTVEIVAEAPDRGFVEFLGVQGFSALYLSCSDDCQIVMTGIDSGEEVASIQVASRNVRLGPDGGTAMAVDAENDELHIIDVNLDSLNVETVVPYLAPTPPAVSGDRSMMVRKGNGIIELSMLYRAGSTELWPTEWFALTEEASDGWSPELVWTPGSGSIIYVNQDRPRRPVVLVTVGGSETTLPLEGVPVAVLPGDPEGLAG